MEEQRSKVWVGFRSNFQRIFAEYSENWAPPDPSRAGEAPRGGQGAWNRCGLYYFGETKLRVTVTHSSGRAEPLPGLPRGNSEYWSDQAELQRRKNSDRRQADRSWALRLLNASWISRLLTSSNRCVRIIIKLTWSTRQITKRPRKRWRFWKGLLSTSSWWRRWWVPFGPSESLDRVWGVSGRAYQGQRDVQLDEWDV